MTTNKDINFDIESSSFDFQYDKDLPSLNCVDLFSTSTKFVLNDPDSGGENRILSEPTSSDSNQDSSNNLSKKSKKKFSPSRDSTVEDNLEKFLENFETDLEIGKNTPEDIEEYIKDIVDSRSKVRREDTNSTKSKLSESNFSKSDEVAQIKDRKKDKISLNTRKMGKLSMEKKMVSFDEKLAIPKLILATPSLSPSLSVSSDYSSTNESIGSKTSTIVKRNKSRRCLTCAISFNHTRDLHNHLKLHVKLPHIRLMRLHDNNPDLQNFYMRTNVKKESKMSEPENNNGNSLKLKLKLSKTQNFEVVQCGDNKLNENKKENTTKTQSKEEPIQIKEEPLSPDDKKEEETKMENENSQETISPSSSKTSLLKPNRNTRILTAKEIKQSPPHCPEELNTNNQSKSSTEDSQLSLVEANNSDNAENRYFECPTFDGLSQFVEDSAINETCTDDLLKKLLEGGSQQQVSQEQDWNGLTSEFISIDRLGHTCKVCQSNFTSSNQLYEHKRTTGHNFKISGIVSSSSLIERQNLPKGATNMMTNNSFPSQHYSLSQQNNMVEPFGQISVRRPVYPGQLQMNSIDRSSGMPGYSTEGGYLIGGNNYSPQQLFHHQRQRQLMQLQQQQRRPPPLYRMPTGEQHPRLRLIPSNVHGRHYNEMNPGMYMPPPNVYPSSRGVISNPYGNSSQHVNRHPSDHLFMKSRLYRPIRPKPTNNVEEASQHGGFLRSLSPSYLNSCPPIDSSVNEMPTAKRSRIEAPSMRGSENSGSMQTRVDTFPSIQRVQSSVLSTEFQGRSKSSMNRNENTLVLRNKDGNQNPKEVANILAIRGITVTQKSKQQHHFQEKQSSLLNSSKDQPSKDAQISPKDAMQKLQLNNSVSIISRKRSAEMSSSSANGEGLLGIKEVPSLNANNVKTHIITAPGRSETNNVDISSTFISCLFADCEEKFLTFEGLNRHKQRFHSSSKESGVPLEAPLKTSKCNLCPAMFSTQEGLSNHQRKSHPVLKTTADELGIPVIDLRNENTKQKLASLGIINYIPLNSKQANGYFGLPIVSVQGAANPNVCNVFAMGVNNLLSLGPIKPIPMRVSAQDNSGTK